MGKRARNRKRKEKRAKRAAVAHQAHVLAEQEQRLFESAETTRLNCDQWSGVKDQPINYALQQDLPTLQKRCHHDATTTPWLRASSRHTSLT